MANTIEKPDRLQVTFFFKYNGYVSVYFFKNTSGMLSVTLL